MTGSYRIIFVVFVVSNIVAAVLAGAAKPPDPQDARFLPAQE